jgi:hypothetical protein
MTGAISLTQPLTAPHTHNNTTLSCRRRVLCSDCLNHINPCVYLARVYESLNPPTNEPQRAALIVVLMKVS